MTVHHSSNVTHLFHWRVNTIPKPFNAFFPSWHNFKNLVIVVLPSVLLQVSCNPQLETMRHKSWKDGYLYTIVPTGTCAKAVCLHLLQCQHGWGCQGKPCGCDCPSQLQKIPFSNFLTIKTIEKFASDHVLGK